MKTLIVACVLTSWPSVATADLRYTTRAAVRLAPVPTASDAYTAIAATLRALMPAAETTTFVSRDAVRIEPAAGTSGPIVLIRNDRVTVLDAGARTYWRGPALSGLAGVATAPTFRRTGEFATLLGLQAERVVFTSSMKLPVTPPAGFPTAFEVIGEIWVADGFPQYAKVLGLALTALPAAGRPQGMVLRQIVRIPQFGYEIEHTVADLVEEMIAASLYEVPEDYREAASPPGPAASSAAGR